VGAFSLPQAGGIYVTDSTTLDRKRVEALAKLLVVADDTNVTDHAAIRTDVAARRTFADVESGTDRLHSSTSLCRLQKFPEATILSASILSA
jgi:CMP-2-keto-3-deoxyoctulosonic acid synthetase